MTENAEVVALRRQVTELMDRVGRLQTIVDAHGEREVKAIAGSIYDAGSASDAAETHDEAWFASLPYSRGVVARMATGLLAALQPYPFIDTTHIATRAQVRTSA